MSEVRRKFHSVKMLQQEEFRLHTFANWPKDFIAPSVMARSGFYFMKNKDHVQCFFCRGIVGFWEKGDIPDEEHKRHFENCPLMSGTEIGNVPLDGSPLNKLMSDYTAFKLAHRKPPVLKQAKRIGMGGDERSFIYLPSYTTVDSRMQTYNSAHKGMFPNHTLMAEAGFIYTGISDFVLCFRCGGGIFNWTVYENPWDIHRQSYPFCPHVQLSRDPTALVEPMDSSEPADGPSRSQFLSEEEADLLATTPLAKRVQNLGMSYESIKASFKELVESRGLLPVTVNEAMDIVATWQENRAEQTKKNSSPQPPLEHPPPEAMSLSLTLPTSGGSTGARQGEVRVSTASGMSSLAFDGLSAQNAASNSGHGSQSFREEKRLSNPVPPQGLPSTGLSFVRPQHLENAKFGQDSTNSSIRPGDISPEMLLMTLAIRVSRLRQAVQAEKERLLCRCCRSARAVILTLPCQHLHLCNVCFIISDTCPTCNKTFNGTVKPINSLNS